VAKENCLPGFANGPKAPPSDFPLRWLEALNLKLLQKYGNN